MRSVFVIEGAELSSQKDQISGLTRVPDACPACPMESVFVFYSIGVKLTQSQRSVFFWGLPLERGNRKRDSIIWLKGSDARCARTSPKILV